MEFIQSYIIPMAILLALFLIPSLLLAKLQRIIYKTYQKSVGWYAMLVTGIVGVPMQISAHWLCAKVFRHRIEHLSFFKLNKSRGGMGQIAHTFNRSNPFHNIGNLFIGFSPTIVAIASLLLVFKYLLPGGDSVLATLFKDFSSFSEYIEVSKLFFLSFFEIIKGHGTDVLTWISIYLILAISSHSGPNLLNRRGVLVGAFWVFILLAIVSVINSFISIPQLGVAAGGMYAGKFVLILFGFLIFIQIIHLLLASLLLAPFAAVKDIDKSHGKEYNSKTKSKKVIAPQDDDDEEFSDEEEDDDEEYETDEDEKQDEDEDEDSIKIMH